MINDTPRRSLPRWVSGIVVLLVAIALVAPGPFREFEKVGSTVLAPVQMGVSGSLHEVSTVVGTLQRVRDLAEENEHFKEELGRYGSQLAQMKELEAENRDLRNLLNLKERTGPNTLLPVSVIARDDTPYVQAITIDRGTSGGVRQGSIVITHAGLVGQVVRANPTTSKVLLISDVTSGVAVRIQSDSRPTGMLKGQAQANALVVDFIPQKDSVKVGDTVITSGEGEVFPEGLVVGQVSRLQQKPADPFQMAAVEPSVDMTKLERLYVLADPKSAP
jgi:rod shape-determining protein MreC